MRGRAFLNGERSVSEIYGTLLIISIVLITALILVGLGTYVVQDLTTGSDDDLARQSVLEIDDSIDELTEGDIEQSTTISVPDGTGEDFTVQNKTTVTLRATTNDTDWHSTDPPKPGKIVDGDDQTNETTLHIGSIAHEADDGSQVVYQGGAVWEVQDGNMRMVDSPDMDYVDGSLQMGLVDVTDINLIQEGNEVTLRRDPVASQDTTSELLQTIYSQMKKDGEVTARANMTLVIQGPYAKGWKEYAENGTTASLMVTWKSDQNKVIIEFPDDFGDPIANIGKDYDDPIIYSSQSEYAPIKYNDDHGEVNELSPGATPGDDTRNFAVEPKNPGSEDIELGIRYNHEDTGYAWWVWNGTKGKWENIENNSMAMKSTTDIDVVTGDPSTGLSTGEFKIKNGTWSCAVRDTGSDDEVTEFYKHVNESGEGCLQNPMGVENPDDHVADLDPHYKVVSYDYTVVDSSGSTIESNPSDGVELTQGSHHINLTLTVKNTGYGTAKQPIAVVANQTKILGSDYWLYDGDKVEIAPGDTWTPSEDYQFNTTGIAADKYNMSAGTPDDGIGESNSLWFEVKYEPTQSTFDIVDGSVTVDDTDVTAGDPSDPVTVEADIENTGKSGTQVVKLKANGKAVVYKEVTIGDGNTKTVTFEWFTASGDDTVSEINVTTYDDWETAPVDIDSGVDNTNFKIQDTAGDTVFEEDTATLNVSIKNTGEAGTQHVVLRNPATGRVVGQDITLSSGQQKWVEFDWETNLGDAGDYTLSFETYNDDETVNLEIKEDTLDTDFELHDVSVTSFVTAGDTVEISLRVKNNGTDEDARKVWVRDFEDRIVNTSSEFTLGDGDTREITLTWQTKPSDSEGEMPKNITIGVTEGGEQLEAEVTVQNPNAESPQFVIENITEFNSPPSDPIVENETLKFTAAVTNIGEKPDEQNLVLFDFDGDPVVIENNVLLNESETKFITFEWDTIIGDAGNGTLNVTTADHSKEFDAEITPKEDEVRPPVDVVFALDETGSMGFYDWDQDAGPNDNGQLGFDDLPYTVPEGQVVVMEPPDYCSENCAADEYNYGDDADDTKWFMPGETVTQDEFDPTVHKYITIMEPTEEHPSFGECDGEELCFDPFGERLNATEIALGAMNGTMGDRAGILEFTTDYNIYQPLTNDLDAANESLRAQPGGGTDISAGIDGAETELTFNGDPDNKQVMIILTDGKDTGGPDPVERAKSVSDDITIYTVGFGKANDETLEKIAAQGSGEGRYIEAENKSELAKIFDEIIDEVTEPDTPEFEIKSLDPETVEGGETLNVTATIHNNGTVGGEQPIVLSDFDGNYIDSKTVHLEADETMEVNLTFDTSGEVDWTVHDDEYTDELSVVTPASESTTEVTILEPPVPVFEIDRVDVVEGSPSNPIYETETLNVEVEITNTGDSTGTQQLTLINDDTGDPLNSSVSVTIGAGETKVVELTYSTEPGDRDIEEILVDSGDATETADVEVLAGDGSDAVTFDIEGVYPDDSDATAGDVVDIHVNVTNPNSQENTDYVTLLVPDGGGGEYIVASKEITIGANSHKNVTLQWNTETTDDGVTPVNATVVGDYKVKDVQIDPLGGDDVDFQFEEVKQHDAPDDVGETLELNVTLKNHGADDGKRTIVLVDEETGNPIASQEITLTSGETKNIEYLEWDNVPYRETGDVTVKISGTTKEEQPALDIRRNDPSTSITFGITDVRPDSPKDVQDEDDPPTAGNVTIEVDVEVTANNYASGQTVYIELNTSFGRTVDYVEIDGDFTGTKTLEWDTHPAFISDSMWVRAEIRGAATSNDPIYLAEPEAPQPGGPGIGGGDDGVDIDVDEITIGS